VPRKVPPRDREPRFFSRTGRVLAPSRVPVPVALVPIRPSWPVAARVTPASPAMPASPRRGTGGPARSQRDLGANRLKAIFLRLDLVRGGVQRTADELGEVMPLGLHALGVRPGSRHNSCSRAARRAAMARDV